MSRSVHVKDVKTTTPNVVVEVTVNYQTGGTNWFHGTTEEGGYYVGFQKVEIQEGVGGLGYTSRLSMVGRGFKVLEKAADRFNAKTLQRTAEWASSSLKGHGLVWDYARKLAEREGLTLAEEG